MIDASSQALAASLDCNGLQVADVCTVVGRLTGLEAEVKQLQQDVSRAFELVRDLAIVLETHPNPVHNHGQEDARFDHELPNASNFQVTDSVTEALALGHQGVVQGELKSDIIQAWSSETRDSASKDVEIRNLNGAQEETKSDIVESSSYGMGDSAAETEILTPERGGAHEEIGSDVTACDMGYAVAEAVRRTDLQCQAENLSKRRSGQFQLEPDDGAEENTSHDALITALDSKVYELHLAIEKCADALHAGAQKGATAAQATQCPPQDVMQIKEAMSREEPLGVLDVTTLLSKAQLPAESQQYEELAHYPKPVQEVMCLDARGMSRGSPSSSSRASAPQVPGHEFHSVGRQRSASPILIRARPCEMQSVVGETSASSAPREVQRSTSVTRLVCEPRSTTPARVVRSHEIPRSQSVPWIRPQETDTRFCVTSSCWRAQIVNDNSPLPPELARRRFGTSGKAQWKSMPAPLETAAKVLEQTVTLPPTSCVGAPETARVQVMSLPPPRSGSVMVPTAHSVTATSAPSTPKLATHVTVTTPNVTVRSEPSSGGSAQLSVAPCKTYIQQSAQPKTPKTPELPKTPMAPGTLTVGGADGSLRVIVGGVQAHERKRLPCRQASLPLSDDLRLRRSFAMDAKYCKEATRAPNTSPT